MMLRRSTAHVATRPRTPRVSRARALTWTGRAVVSSETDTRTPRAASANLHRTRVSEMRLADRADRRVHTPRHSAPVFQHRAHRVRNGLLSIGEHH